MAGIVVRVLGSLEVTTAGGDRLPVNGDRQRALVAALALAGGRPVSVAELMTALWGDDGDHEHRLQQQVSTLRKVLEPERPRNVEPSVLVTQSPGYALHDAAVDLDGFTQDADEGMAAARDGRWDEALTWLERALAQWRGPALADVRVSAWFDAQATRLEERGTAVQEARVDAMLEVGREVEAAAELEALVQQHPFRERFRAQLMLALYRANRQADALAAYARTRSLLIDELGVEPSPELRSLEQAILAHDPSLQRRAPAATGELLETVRPDQLDHGYICRPDGQIITLGEGANVIGRDPEAQVLLADSRVSRLHARIDKDAAGFRVLDLGSTNGTTVNGQPAAGQLLVDGDVIGLGRVEVTFRFGRLDQA